MKTLALGCSRLSATEREPSRSPKSEHPTVLCDQVIKQETIVEALLTLPG